MTTNLWLGFWAEIRLINSQLIYFYSKQVFIIFTESFDVVNRLHTFFRRFTLTKHIYIYRNYCLKWDTAGEWEKSVNLEISIWNFHCGLET